MPGRQVPWEIISRAVFFFSEVLALISERGLVWMGIVADSSWVIAEGAMFDVVVSLMCVVRWVRRMMSLRTSVMSTTANVAGRRTSS